MQTELPPFPFEEIPSEWLYSLAGLAGLFVAAVLFLNVYSLKLSLRLCGGGNRGLLFSAFGLIIASLAAGGTSAAVSTFRPSSTLFEILAFSASGTIAAYSVLFWINPIRAVAVYLLHLISSTFTSVVAAIALLIAFATLIPSEVKDRLADISTKYQHNVREQIAQAKSKQQSGSDIDAGSLTSILGSMGLDKVTPVKSSGTSEKTKFSDSANFFFSDSIQKSIDAVRAADVPATQPYDAGVKKNPFFKPSK